MTGETIPAITLLAADLDNTILPAARHRNAAHDVVVFRRGLADGTLPTLEARLQALWPTGTVSGIRDRLAKKSLALHRGDTLYSVKASFLAGVLEGCAEFGLRIEV